MGRSQIKLDVPAVQLGTPWVQHSRWFYGGVPGEAPGVHVRLK